MFDIKLKYKIAPGFKEKVATIKGDKLRALGDRVIEKLKDHIDRQFSTEGSASGRPWKTLSKKYAEWKRKKFGDKPILTRTGLLREKVKFVVVKQDKTSLTIEGRVPLSYPITEKVTVKNLDGEERIINRLVKRRISYSTLKEKGKLQRKPFVKVRYGIFHEFGSRNIPQRMWLQPLDSVLMDDIKKIIQTSDIYGLR